jgi:Big-like domain-containing protein
VYKLSIALVLAAALSASGCNAALPVEPTPAPSVAGLQLLFSSPVGTIGVNGFISVSAVVFDADGVYRNVTRESAWTTSDVDVVGISSAGFLRTFRPGVANITATYQGRTASVFITVGSAPRFPYLDISPAGDPRSIGGVGGSQARLMFGPSNWQDVTSAATWSSSDPRVATVSQGRVTGAGVGTTTITAVYDGYSAGYQVSVPPRGFPF